MVDPRHIHNLAAGVSAVLVLLFAAAQLGGPLAEWWRWVANARAEVHVLLLALLFFLSAFVPFYMLNRRWFEERARHENTKQSLAKANAVLKESEKLKHIDVVTRIPNQKKWEIDIETVSSKVSDFKPYQLILIDLVGFGSINKSYGYSIGDAVLRYFATSVYESMRRNEEAYKRPFEEAVADNDLWKRVYRKYTGGDEFMFIIMGPEVEAIGFLNRLQKRIDDEYSEYISKEILREPYRLSFQGAVVPLMSGDDHASAWRRLEDALRKTSQTGSAGRVFWWSERKSSDFKHKSFEASTYRQAEEFFGSPAPGPG